MSNEKRLQLIEECLDYFDFNLVYEVMCIKGWDKVMNFEQEGDVRVYVRQRLKEYISPVYLSGDEYASITKGTARFEYFAEYEYGVITNIHVKYVLTDWRSGDGNQ